MRKAITGLTALTLGVSLAVAAVPPAGAAPPPGTTPTAEPEAATAHELPNPLEDKRRQLREQALTQVVNGEATPTQINGSTVVQVGEQAGAEATGRRGRKPAKNQYVELAREATDRVFVLLVEFGDQRHPQYPDQDTDPDTPGPARFDGPRHNEIPEPDRSVDNTTVWQPDFSQQYFQDLYFGTGRRVETMKTYYERQSSGRYSIDGAASAWVTVPFNEPDHYVDHLQIVHSGGDQADGDPHQGEDAIWSHRWYAWVTDAGITGPEDNPLGGTEIGGTGLWAGDYTVQPENGGLSTIAHEYGHDLGLPDHYDTAGGQNSVEWWNLMAQSRLSGRGEPIGTRAGDLSAWDKLQLGWLNYTVTRTGDDATVELGPHEYNTAKPQAVIHVLPDKPVQFDYGEPFAGERFWWSTRGDDLATSMTRDVDLTGATSAAIDLEARYAIESGFDYLYVQASTDGGATWTSLDGTVAGQPFVRDASGSPAISGSSGGEWRHVAVPLDAYAGQAVSVRFFYRTDGGVAPVGFFADEIVVSADGAPVVTSGAETDDEGWALDGFRATTGSETGEFDNFYIGSHRSYESFDRYLRTGPYNFGFLNTRPDWVEHFSYEQGFLLSYWDTSQTDNNTSEHPGEGEILPVDAHPTPIVNTATGTPWRSRIQSYDAPFSLERPRSFTLHTNGVPSHIRGARAQPVFDDADQYWFPSLPGAGVKVPTHGVRMEVTARSGTSLTVHVTS